MNKTILIGYGSWGKKIYHTLNSMKDFKIIKIIRKNIRYNNKSLFSNNLLDIKKSIAANSVFICTPNKTHFKIAKYALENDKNVFLEKPACFNNKEYSELSNIAKKNKLIFHVNYIYFYNNKIIEFYNLIKKHYNKNKKINVQIYLGKKLNGKSFFENYWDWTPHIFTLILMFNPKLNLEKIKSIKYSKKNIILLFNKSNLDIYCKYGYGFIKRELKISVEINQDKYLFDNEKIIINKSLKIFNKNKTKKKPLEASIIEFRNNIKKNNISSNNHFKKMSYFLEKNYKKR